MKPVTDTVVLLDAPTTQTYVLFPVIRPIPNPFLELLNSELVRPFPLEADHITSGGKEIVASIARYRLDFGERRLDVFTGHDQVLRCNHSTLSVRIRTGNGF